MQSLLFFLYAQEGIIVRILCSYLDSWWLPEIMDLILEMVQGMIRDNMTKEIEAAMIVAMQNRTKMTTS